MPALVGTCGDRDPPVAFRDDRHKRVLVVRQRPAPVTAPPFYQVPSVGPAAKEGAEGDKKGVRVETPAHFLGRASVGRAGRGGGLKFLRRRGSGA